MFSRKKTADGYGHYVPDRYRHGIRCPYCSYVPAPLPQGKEKRKKEAKRKREDEKREKSAERKEKWKNYIKNSGKRVKFQKNFRRPHVGGLTTVYATSSELHGSPTERFHTTSWEEIRKNFWPKTRLTRAMPHQSWKIATIILVKNAFKIGIQMWLWYHWNHRKKAHRMIYILTFYCHKKLFFATKKLFFATKKFFATKNFFLPQNFFLAILFFLL